jgi:formate C-acetyltransferase
MLKKLVFGPNASITAADFKSALASNYEGYDTLYARINNDPDRMGNDSKEVDALAREMFDFMLNEVAKHKNPLGGSYLPMGISFTCNQDYKDTPASPDGRKQGEPLAAVHSSVHGCDRSGLTALFNSMAKIDWSLAPGSMQCGISIHPSMAATESDRQKLISLLKTQIAAGGFSQILVNFLDDEILREARANPAKYRNINVRVSGYNAQFTDLPPSVQDEIIKRTKHRA